MLTDMGTFVAQLGVDLLLGRLVGLASMFGCLPEVSGWVCVCDSLSYHQRLPLPVHHRLRHAFPQAELTIYLHLPSTPNHLPKALAMAAVLNCQRSPFRIASPLG